MHPKPGTIYNVKTGKWEPLSQADLDKFKFSHKTIKLGNESCAEFSKDGATYLQPWEKLVYLKRRGSKNIMAKLSEIKLKKAMIDAFMHGVDLEDLATKLDVTPEHLKRVLNGQGSWKWLTRPFLEKLKKDSTLVVEEMKSFLEAPKEIRKAGTKVTLGIVKFIIRDYFLHGIQKSVLAEKYKLSVRQVQRILSGKAWNTKELIEEYKNWETK